MTKEDAHLQVAMAAYERIINSWTRFISKEQVAERERLFEEGGAEVAWDYVGRLVTEAAKREADVFCSVYFKVIPEANLEGETWMTEPSQAT